MFFTALLLLLGTFISFCGGVFSGQAMELKEKGRHIPAFIFFLGGFFFILGVVIQTYGTQ
jgi:hypothetical protein